ncbi:hypothetical protein QQX98_007779 [Neonectria punicea]|uniref:Rhodopsin domain-containing protein n=1 Tax=Neonectria punicea TaxID=979145 RepID=A0ABR1GWX6_9HYPO
MGIEEQFILLSLGLVTIAVRVSVRWQQAGPANWQLDDYLMPLTGLVFTAEVVAAYLVGAKFQGMTNSYIDDEQRAAIDPDSVEYYNRQWGSKIQVIGWSLYAFILWALKFCVTSFYSRLTSGLQQLKLRVKIAYILLAVTYAVVALTILLSCYPTRKFWQINPDPGTLCRPTNSPAYVLVVVIPNILTDLYLLSIPLPLLWGVNISLRKKLTLMILFSGAIFVIMAATIRAVVILTAGLDGAISGSAWACRETFVSIIVTNLPIIQPLIRRGASKIGLSALFSRTSPTTRESHQLNSNPTTGSKFNTSRKRGASRHPISDAQVTAWASDEHILPEDEDGKSTTTKEPGVSVGILVAQEVRVQSNPLPDDSGASTDARRDDWGYQVPNSRDERAYRQ